MRTIQFVILLCVILAGLLGAYFRGVELDTIFDIDTGLAETGAPITTMLVVLASAVMVAAVIAALLLKKSHEERPFYETFRLHLGLHSVVNAVAGMGFIGAGLLYYFVEEYLGLVQKVYLAFCIVSGVCLIMQAACELMRRDGAAAMFSVSVLPVFLALKLVIVFRGAATDPVLLDYVYECLSLALSALALCGYAGSAFGQLRYRSTHLFTLVAIYFTLVTMADSHAMYDRLMYIATAAVLVSNAAALIANLVIRTPRHLSR